MWFSPVRDGKLGPDREDKGRFENDGDFRNNY